jgi:tRNA threonylcarbamoyladenosine biosynthesis protein TsaB
VEPLILGIETATTVFAVGLSRGHQLIARTEVFLDKYHARLIAVAVQQLLDNLELKPNDLDAVAVSAGPGSYTGLRIGMAAAKGYCMALDKPLITIGTLEALAAALRHEAERRQACIVPLLDARRMEVYTATYAANGEELDPPGAVIMDRARLENLNARRPALLVGDGVTKCLPLMEGLTNLIPYAEVKPSVEGLLHLAAICFAGQQFANLAIAEPLYLKPPATTEPRKRQSFV